MDYAKIAKKITAYKGPKVAIVVTGGGQGIAQLSTVIGSSKLLHAILIPYSYDESAKLIEEAFSSKAAQEYRDKAVSKRSARLLSLAGLHRWPDCRVIACTSATTTSRWRRGENQSYIAVSYQQSGGPSEIEQEHHIKLSKLSEEDYHFMGPGYVSWKRQAEDRKITEQLLKVIFEEV